MPPSDAPAPAPTFPGRGRPAWVPALTRGRIGVGVVLVVLALNAVVDRADGAAPGHLDRADGAAPGHLGPIDAAAGAVGLALLVVAVRLNRPREALAAALAVTVASVAVTERPTAVLPAVVLLLFVVALRCERRQAVAAGVGTAAVALLSLVAFTPVPITDPALLAPIVWSAAAVAVGDAIRSRRAYVAAVEERARRAEETREEEARRRVAEERLRIARDLHDLVAHRIAVVNVQAGLAAHLLRADPDQAEEALRVVRSSAGTVLDELGQLLSVLRRHDDREPGPAPTHPTPGLADLPALVASFADAGLAVGWETSGHTRPVSDGTALAVYRTVQEALTNAHKHGAGTARAALEFRPTELEVRVDNPMGAVPRRDPERRSTGFGLVGMRERVTSAGGTLEAGAEGDRFRVQARFPLPPDDRARP